VVDLSVEGGYRIIRPGTGYAQTLATLIKHGLVERIGTEGGAKGGTVDADVSADRGKGDGKAA
jgi:hypothetical protein